MPIEERDSPRAAIRNWLHSTESAAEAGRHELSERCNHRHTCKSSGGYDIGMLGGSQSPQQSRKELNPRKQANGERKTKGQHVKSKSPSPLNGHPQRRTERRKKNGPSLAERLDLHAPFRSFKDGSDDDLNHASRPRKRKRHMSSTSSYLEPAEIKMTKTDDGVISPGKRKCAPANVEPSGERSRRNPQGFVTALPASVIPAKFYEKRSRHKTREDHYTLKEHADKGRKQRSGGKDQVERKHTKRKRKEKSGAALMHHFSAQNVSRDRLTLHPQSSLGFFGKGRASSPVKRRGLPDLAFSELTFLNSRRTKPAEVTKNSGSRPSKTTRQRKSTKAADTETEISRYFMSSKAQNDESSDQYIQSERQPTHKSGDGHVPTPTFVGLPDTPFLGFGSRGENSLSPAKGLNSPALQDLEKRITKSPSRSTSYLTWSESGIRSQASSCYRKKTNSPSKLLQISMPKEGSPRKHQARLSHSPNPLRTAEKTSVKKHSPVASPSQDKSNKSDHIQYSSSQILARPAEQTANSRKSQEIRNVARNPSKAVHCSQKPTTKDFQCSPRTQVSLSPKSHYPKSTPLPAGIVRDHADQPSSARTTTRQILESKDRARQKRLDEALEALLMDCKTNRTVDDIESMIRQRKSGALGSHDHLTTIPTNKHLCSLSRSSSHCRLAATASSSRCSVSARTNHEHMNRVAQISPKNLKAHSPTRSNPLFEPSVGLSNGSYQRLKSDLPLNSDYQRGETRSTWTGYGTLFEQQQISHPLWGIGGVQEPDHNSTSTYINGPHETDAYQQRYYDELPSPNISWEEDDLGSMRYNNLAASHDAYAQGEAPADFTALYDVEENLFAEHEMPLRGTCSFPTSDMMQMSHVLEEEPLQFPERSFRPSGVDQRFSEQDVRSADLTGDSNDVQSPLNHHPVHTITTTYAQNTANDLAMSDFWRPHRLY